MNVRWSCALKVNNSTPSIFSWLLQKTALLLYLPSIKRQFLLKKCPFASDSQIYLKLFGHRISSTAFE